MNSFTDEGMRLADNYRSEWVNSKLTTQDRREALRSHLQAREARIEELEKYAIDKLGDVIWTSDGKEYCDEDIAMAVLLIEGIVWTRGASYVGNEDSKFEFSGKTTICLMACNDVFAWGCADCEDLPHTDIPSLYKSYAANKKWGSTQWICLRRNQKPQAAVRKAMQKDGAWSDELEALPENGYDIVCKQMAEERALKAAGEAVNETVAAPQEGRGT